MNAEDLRSVQAPLKERYRETPEAAQITLRAQGRIDEGVSCKVETGKALSLPGCIRPLVAADRLRARATCCSKRWLPAPA